MRKRFTIFLFFVLGCFNSFSQTIGQEVLNFQSGCGDNAGFVGTVVKTKFPFANHLMANIIIEGYNYGMNETIDWKINYYTYQTENVPWHFYHSSISTGGAYNPEIKLYNDGGFVSIFIAKGDLSQYCINFKIRAWQSYIPNEASWFQNWSASLITSDPTLTLPSNHKINCTYKNNFGGATGNVAIGGRDPITKLTVTGPFTPVYMQLAIKNNTIGEGIGISFNENTNNRTGYLYARSGVGLILGDETGYGLRAFSGGNEVLTARNNGNVGIGVGQPTEKLQVAGDIFANLRLAFQDNARFNVSNTNIPTLNPTTFSMPHYGIAAPSTSSSADLWISGNGAIRMFTAGNPNPTINVINNNLGIGNLNPQTKLEISNDANFSTGFGTGQLRISGASNKNRMLSVGYDTHNNNGFLQAGESGVTYTNLALNPVGGNVGIGLINPYYKLEVNGSSRILGTNYISGAFDGTARVVFTPNGIGNIWEEYPQTNGFGLYDRTNSIFRYFISNNGNFGIGTITPNAKLEVVKNFRISSNTTGFGYEFLRSDDDHQLDIQYMASNTKFSNIMTLHYTGKVGIATSNIPNDYKLAVGGNIIAEKVKVKKRDTSGNWPDFVFSPSYKLPNLTEVENFVKQNQHLPEIPSASEIEKEGQDLGEMNRLLLKKVEELTLYIINQEKRIQELEKKSK